MQPTFAFQRDTAFAVLALGVLTLLLRAVAVAREHTSINGALALSGLRQTDKMAYNRKSHAHKRRFIWTRNKLRTCAIALAVWGPLACWSRMEMACRRASLMGH